jgi:hypothetical protein
MLRLSRPQTAKKRKKPADPTERERDLERPQSHWRPCGTLGGPSADDNVANHAAIGRVNRAFATRMAWWPDPIPISSINWFMREA